MAGTAKIAKTGSTARSIFAIVDGLFLFFALEGVFYAIAYLILRMSFDTPRPGYLTMNLLWAVAAALFAGYVTARVARRAPIQHGVALAVPFLLLSLYNLNKGLGGRHTPFVLAVNTLVPLGFIWGAYLWGRKQSVTPLAVRAE